MFDGLYQGRGMFELGARLGQLGTVAIGDRGGPLAKALARAAGCGAALAGAEVRFHDGSCAACGVWLAGYYGFPAALFLRQMGEKVSLYVMDGAGQPIRLEELPLPAAGEAAGQWDLLVGADQAWASARSAGRRRSGVVCAQGMGALTLALERLGCEVTDRPVPGAPVFRADREGFLLTVEWDGALFHPVGADALAAAVEFAAPRAAVPAFGPLRRSFPGERDPSLF